MRRRRLGMGLVVAMVCWGQSPAGELRGLEQVGQASALAARWVKEGRERAAAAGRMLLAGEEGERRKARAVLNDLEELAWPVLVELRGLRAEDEAWRLRMLAEEMGSWRGRAARMIDGQLGNKTLVPREKKGRGEGREWTRRVCDEAYGAMVEMLRGSEAMGREMRVYGEMSEAQRDGLIRVGRAGAGWQAILKGATKE